MLDFFLSDRYEKENAARKKAEKELNDLRKQLSDKENQLSKVNNEARNLEQVMRELQSECQELKEALEAAKYALEQETLTRVDLENKLQSLKEELSFKRSVYDKVS
jgi:chromosome segregation ATPase